MPELSNCYLAILLFDEAGEKGKVVVLNQYQCLTVGYFL